MKIKVDETAVSSTFDLRKKCFDLRNFWKIFVDEYKELIEAHGRKNISGIFGKTSFVLAGKVWDHQKLKRAAKLSIPLIMRA